MTGPLVIAEAGVNHNGSLDRALEMVDVAASAGADVIKFQTFAADSLARPDAELAEYQKRSSGGPQTQWELLKGLELSREEFIEIKQRCVERGVLFLSTGFTLPELDFLVSELSIPMIKIASGDLTFAPMLVAAAQTGLPVVLSTGMANLDEIAEALTFLAVGYGMDAGYLPADTVPSRKVRDGAWESKLIRQRVRESVTVLHCTTQYPAPVEDLNLRAMVSIAEAFDVKVGYSDHSMGDYAAIAATALGATIVEKHFTLDRSLEGPDHAASMEPDELTRLVRTLRDVHTAMGSGVKECQPSETANRAVVRRSIVAARGIDEGTVILEDDLECRRPADGRSAFAFWDVVGTTAAQRYEAGDYID